ncbi:hypothetical protein ACFYNY_35615 [Streptomyces sp. NPDC006530]|uniref:hypothetical protein n=1 Tax=Streptomyces sp. NPDC006530 TaxID=3364750 RepID=UPI0036BD769F
MDADQDLPSTVDAPPDGVPAAPQRWAPTSSAVRPTRRFEGEAGAGLAHPEASRPPEMPLTRTAAGAGRGSGGSAAPTGSGT